MIKSLLKPGTCPEWYDDAHLELAKKGMRVIALARRKVSVRWAHHPCFPFMGKISFSPSTRKPACSCRSHFPIKLYKLYSIQELRDKPRKWAEKNLEFVAFLAFRCLVRKDSAAIIQVHQRPLFYSIPSPLVS
jgi:magnesium-transporting ATPase (P-type)